MNLEGKTFVAIGGGGLIGSHTVDNLLKEDVNEIIIYDNFFSRGSEENLTEALKDSRVKIYEDGGDILHKDILDAALKNADGVFHFAALWLLQCHLYPESAFDVNIKGTFNVMQSCIENNVQRLFTHLQKCLWRCNQSLWMKIIHIIIRIFTSHKNCMRGNA